MPNINFISSGFKKLENLHFELNTFIKFSVAAVDNLNNTDLPEEELKDRIAGLIKRAGERWVATRFSKPHDKLQMVRLQLTKSGIMWVYSAFEVYLNYTHSYCSERMEPVSTLEAERKGDTLKIEELFNKYGWDTVQLNYLRPLLDFYTEARHCIVHNMAKANQTMIDVLNSSDFKKSIEKWPTVKAERQLSPAPVILEDGQIIFKPHHAITYSDICLRIARIVDSNIFNTLGDLYFIKTIAEMRLLKAKRISGHPCDNIYVYIRTQLFDEFHISTINDATIKCLLEENDLLDSYKMKYKELKSKTTSVS